MTLTIELPDEQEAALKAKAQARGVSAEQYAQQVLKRDLAQQTRPISARIREIWSDMPDDVREKLPTDGAAQIDHYVYSVPKKNR
jgi:hypothetical protein